MLKLRYKIKSGALQYVISLSILFTFILFGFILLVSGSSFFQLKTEKDFHQLQKVTEGLIVSLGNETQSNRVVLDESLEGYSVERNFFGLLEKRESSFEDSNNQFKKIAFVGRKPDLNGLALYLPNKHNPIYLVGNTKVKGAVALSQEGFRFGTIGQHSFQGTLDVVNSKVSMPLLPALPGEMVKQMETLQNRRFHREQQQEIAYENTTYRRSFYKTTVFMDISSLDTLSQISLTGNIVLRSTRPIYIAPSAILTDVVLVAPKISIGAYTKGRFQAIASQIMDIGAGCVFSYPSVFWLHVSSQNLDHERTVFKIRKNTSIEGMVGFSGFFSNKQDYLPRMIFSPDVNVLGTVYCDAPLELKGIVNGTVYAKQLVAQHQGNIYVNHLFNAAINSIDLPKDFVRISFENKKPNGIMKWMY